MQRASRDLSMYASHVSLPLQLIYCLFAVHCGIELESCQVTFALHKMQLVPPLGRLASSSNSMQALNVISKAL